MLMASGNCSSSVLSTESVTESIDESDKEKTSKECRAIIIQEKKKHNVMSTGIVGINIKHNLAWY